jgi:hypothetical protein
MATTTPNYGWDVPTSSDYVKDGAVAIEALGDDIDSTLYTALGGNYPGLRLIKKQTIGTAVSSIQVTNAFSATYDNYKIFISGGTSNGNNFGKFILGATTSAYYVGAPGSNYSGSGTTFVATSNAAAANYTWYHQTNWLDLTLEIKNPFLTTRTGFNFSYNSNAAGFAGAGVQESNTSFTDFTISSFGASTFTGGTIYVYGYGIS